MESPEMQKKANPITVAFIITIGFIGFEIGTLMERSNTQDRVIEVTIEYQNKLQEIYHKYALDEVQGLRNDMVKEDAHLWEAIK